MFSNYLRSLVNESFQGLKEGLKGHIQILHSTSSRYVFLFILCVGRPQNIVFGKTIPLLIVFYIITLKFIWKFTSSKITTIFLEEKRKKDKIGELLYQVCDDLYAIVI